MRTRTAGLILLAWAAVAAGQQTFPDPPPVVAPPILTPTSAPGPIAPVIEPPPPAGPPLTVAETLLAPGVAVGQQHVLGAEVQFGRPTGLRVQYALWHGGDFSLLLEGFGGGKSAFWGEEAVVGVGGRVLFTLASDGAKNALVVGPGLSVSHWEANDRPFLVYDPATNFLCEHRGETDRWFLTLDANVGWLHELSPVLGWEVGLNFGVRVGLSGRDRDGKDVGGKVSGGTVGVYTGLRY